MGKRTGRFVVLGSAVLATVIIVAPSASDLREPRLPPEGRSKVLPSPFGVIEYAEGGVGQPVLVIHGSGGGFVQGARFARAVLGADSGWIAPSRFGDLRSTVLPGATFDEQSHAYAFLLDHLGIDRVAVVANTGPRHF